MAMSSYSLTMILNVGDLRTMVTSMLGGPDVFIPTSSITRLVYRTVVTVLTAIIVIDMSGYCMICGHLVAVYKCILLRSTMSNTIVQESRQCLIWRLCD